MDSEGRWALPVLFPACTLVALVFKTPKYTLQLPLRIEISQSTKLAVTAQPVGCCGPFVMYISRDGVELDIASIVLINTSPVSLYSQ
jgi:hypothetical protein